MTEDTNTQVSKVHGRRMMRTVHKGGKYAQSGTDKTFRQEQTKEGFSPARERKRVCWRMLASRDGIGIDSREAVLRCGRKSQLVGLIGSYSCKSM